MTATKTKKRERKAPVGTIAGPCLRTTWRTPDWLLQPVRDWIAAAKRWCADGEGEGAQVDLHEIGEVARG